MSNYFKNGIPGLLHVDHVALTVPDLDTAINFYSDVIGGVFLYKIGPFDANTMPRMPDGRDWCEAHVNVAEACLSIAMLQISPNLMLELFEYDRPTDRATTPPRNCDLGGHHIAFKVRQLDKALDYLRNKGLRVLSGPITLDEGPCAGLRVNYFLDPWGNQLELVEYKRQAFETSCSVTLYRSPDDTKS